MVSQAYLPILPRAKMGSGQVEMPLIPLERMLIHQRLLLGNLSSWPNNLLVLIYIYLGGESHCESPKTNKNVIEFEPRLLASGARSCNYLRHPKLAYRGLLGC